IFALIVNHNSFSPLILLFESLSFFSSVSCGFFSDNIVFALSILSFIVIDFFGTGATYFSNSISIFSIHSFAVA
ncbi:hypothetical protein, partial [Lactococcus lactis]|uniref:hypothetical protein n=1 Tax=Lactococcus lactis TaxID=1358 RepID=UPI00223C1B26